MIQLSNVSNQAWAISTCYNGGRGIPLYLRLLSKTKGQASFVRIMKENLRNYGRGVQEQIADGVQLGIIQVNELDGVHTSPDKTSLPDVTTPTTDLAELIASSIAFKLFFNGHVVNMNFHLILGATTIAAADPTDLAGVITLLTEAITDFNAHLIVAGLHSIDDTSNTMTVGAPVTAQDASDDLNELWAKLRSHKEFAYNSGNPPLSPGQIIGYP